ncbi:MAG TPA: VOC family protein [Pyrinomonadaceae bacterium]
MAQAVGKKAEESFFTGAFSSFSVDDLKEAKEFYGQILGLNVTETEEGLELDIEGTPIFLYPKDDHEPATFTVLNFQVDDIDQAVNRLADHGIEFESYGGELETDENGVFRGKEDGNGPNIAWFKDPAGNFLSVIEN